MTLWERNRQCNAPLGVPIVLNVKLALAKSVPKFNGPVPAPAHNLPVVSTETDAEDIGCVSDESTSGLAGV